MLNRFDEFENGTDKLEREYKLERLEEIGRIGRKIRIIIWIKNEHKVTHIYMNTNEWGIVREN